ncbi:MAG: NAD-dependent succinate-semialdehyde dehydrogenase [Chlorobi bacterium]|nr:NAD-dependent succinate-semialdehyde dehydrogenase [Chlorobiota bacterium]
MQLKSFNPAKEELNQSYPAHQLDEVDEILDKSVLAFKEWRETRFEERAELLRNTADILRRKKDELARIITIEMGKHIRESVAEIEKCAWVCEYYADNGAGFLVKESVQTNASESYVSYRPLGPVLAIMPWNFPFWQVFRFAAPALMGGNTGLLKHASNVPGCSIAIEEVIEEAGFPDNVFRSLLIPSNKVDMVIKDKRVKAVTLTGSTPAGKSVAALAGKYLKKTVLELGGSDPYIILEDADLELAVNACVTGRLINAGQSCIGAKRFVAVDAVYDRFEEMFLEKMKQVRYGDPFEETVDIGPLARNNLREELQVQVDMSVEKGARLLIGGEIPEVPGYYYPPTVLSDVKPGMPAYHDELFGPVASLIRAKDEADAIRIANDTSFGLGGAVFTQNIERGKEIAEFEIEAGSCFVNDFVRSDPRLPFGGIKGSGYGRELSHFGMKEFQNIKTVYIK